MIQKSLTAIFAAFVLPGILCAKVSVSGTSPQLRADTAALADEIYPNQFERIWFLNADFETVANNLCPTGHSAVACFRTAGHILVIRASAAKTVLEINGIMAQVAGVSPEPGDRYAISLTTMTIPKAIEMIWKASFLQNRERVFTVHLNGVVTVVTGGDGTISTAEIPPRYLVNLSSIWHSHPNGDPQPSKIDAATARRFSVPVYAVTRDRIGVVYPNGTVKVAGRSEVLASLNKY